MAGEDEPPRPPWWPPEGFRARAAPARDAPADARPSPLPPARRLSPLEEAWRFINGAPSAPPPSDAAAAAAADPGTRAASPLMRAPSLVVMTDAGGAAHPVHPDPPDISLAGVVEPPPAGAKPASEMMSRGDVPALGPPPAASASSRRGGAAASAGGSVDLTECADLIDLLDVARFDVDVDVGADGGAGDLQAAVDDRESAETARSAAATRRAREAREAALLRSRPARAVSEAARKTAIKRGNAEGIPLIGGLVGLTDAHRAVLKVTELLAREMKPLGMEAAATFDPLSGVLLWREQRRAAAHRKRATRELYGATGVDDDVYPTRDEDAPLPLEDVRGRSGSEEAFENPLPDLRALRLPLAARHAAAAYGSLAAILQNNSMKDKARGLATAVRAAWTSGASADAASAEATAAAARSAGVDASDFVSADWVTLAFSPASYVAVDRADRAVVLAIRGTVSASDLLTDACSEAAPFAGGFAHAGMVISAYQVLKTQLSACAEALFENPGFEFIITGHSMGAGVAAICAMLVYTAGEDDDDSSSRGEEDEHGVKEAAMKRLDELARTRREAAGDASSGGGGGDDDAEARARAAKRALGKCACLCFAAPSVCSLDLSLRARAHTVSVVAGKDVIPRLCYASVRRLLRRLNGVAPSQPVMRAISVALGGRDKNKDRTNEGFSDEPTPDEEGPRRAPDPTNASGRTADDSAAGLEDGGAVLGRRSIDAGSAHPAVESSDARVETRPPPPLHDFAASAAARASTPEGAGRSLPSKPGVGSGSRCQGEWDDLEGNSGLELRDHSASDFLVLPGRVIHLRRLSSSAGPTAEFRHPTAFTEIPISTRMMSDHVPMVYQSAVDAVIAKRDALAREAEARRRREREEEATFGPGGYDVYERAAARVRARRDAIRRRRMASVSAERTSRGSRGSSRTERSRAEEIEPSARLWAKVRRSLGISRGGGGEGSWGARRGGTSGREEASDGDREAIEEASEKSSSDGDLIAAVAELLGFDDDDDDEDEDERDAYDEVTNGVVNDFDSDSEYSYPEARDAEGGSRAASADGNGTPSDGSRGGSPRASSPRARGARELGPRRKKSPLAPPGWRASSSSHGGGASDSGASDSSEGVRPWGGGFRRLGSLLGKLSRDADALFAGGADESADDSADESDGGAAGEGETGGGAEKAEEGERDRDRDVVAGDDSRVVAGDSAATGVHSAAAAPGPHPLAASESETRGVRRREREGGLDFSAGRELHRADIGRYFRRI